MFAMLGIDPFTALALLALGLVVGGFMLVVHLILQWRHNDEGFSWSEPGWSSLGIAGGLGLLVAGGGFMSGSRSWMVDGTVLFAILLVTTLAGGFAGRPLGWLAGVPSDPPPGD